jgi:hypothetical protein
MPKFDEIAEKFKKEALFSSFETVMQNSDFQNVFLNTIKIRLLSKGLDSKENKLQTDIGRQTPSLYTYAAKTIGLKRLGLTLKNNKLQASRQGVRPIDRVTLSQEGDFYQSFNIKTFFEGFEIDADFQKEDGHIADNFKNTVSSQKDFEDLILSMTNKEFNEFLKFVKSKFIKELKTKL